MSMDDSLALRAPHPSRPALKVLDLFSGIGGFSLGLRWAGRISDDRNVMKIEAEFSPGVHGTRIEIRRAGKFDAEAA